MSYQRLINGLVQPMLETVSGSPLPSPIDVDVLPLNTCKQSFIKRPVDGRIERFV